MKKKIFEAKHKVNRIQTRISRFRLYWPLRDMMRRYSEADIANSAAVSTYFILLALFPLLMVITGIIAQVSGESLVTFLDSSQVRNVMPQEVVNLLVNFLSDAETGQNVSVISVSVIGLIWSAGRGIGAIIGALNRTYMVPKKTSMFVRRIIGFAVILVLGISIILILMVLAFSEFIITQVSGYIELNIFNDYLIRYLPYAFAFAYLVLIFTAVYYFASGRSGKIRHAISAGLFTTIVWLLFSFVYSFYINNFSSYSVIYGSLTAVILLLLWLYFMTQVLLIGAFLHRELLRFKGYSIGQDR